MQLFENDPRSGLERLVSDADIYYSRCPEALAIWSAKGEALDEQRAWIQRIVDSFFIRNADEEALDEWEAFLGIKYDNPHPDIDFRRSAVAAFFMPTHHIGEGEIRQIIGKFTDHAVTVEFDKGRVTIVITETFPDEYAVYESILKRLPAHLGFKLMIRIIRNIRYDLLIGHGGYVSALVNADYRPEVAARTHVNMSQGAYTGSVYNPDYRPDVSASAQVNVGGGAYSGSFTHGGAAPPNETYWQEVAVGGAAVAATRATDGYGNSTCEASGSVPIGGGAYAYVPDPGVDLATPRVSAQGNIGMGGGAKMHTKESGGPLPLPHAEGKTSVDAANGAGALVRGGVPLAAPPGAQGHTDVPRSEGAAAHSEASQKAQDTRRDVRYRYADGRRAYCYTYITSKPIRR